MVPKEFTRYRRFRTSLKRLAVVGSSLMMTSTCLNGAAPCRDASFAMITFVVYLGIRPISVRFPTRACVDVDYGLYRQRHPGYGA